MTEDQLIHGVIENDEDSWKALVERYQEMVVNVCYSFIQNRDDALDVSQEVFIKVFDAIATFQGKSKLSTWIPKA